VAFIAAAFACFLLYSGFGAISSLPVFAAGLDYYIGMMGIDFHYRSISRGVIDTRDVLYFLSIIFFFLFLTNRHLAARTSAQSSVKNKQWIPLLLLVLLTGINGVAALIHYRLDLTAEKRYTLSEPTRALLARLDGDVQVDFFLEGNLKAGIRKLAKSSLEMLQDFNEYCGGKIRIHPYDPVAGMDDSARQPFLDSLARMGIQPKTEVAQAGKGEEQNERIVIPGAIIRYKDKVYPVDLLKGVQLAQQGQPEDQYYSNAETLLEFKFANAIDKITRKERPMVGYVMGNGEPLDLRVYDLIEGLRSNYRFGIIALDSIPIIPLRYNAIIIVKPTLKFTDREKLALDQYVLHGGQIIWAISQLYAEQDSLQLQQQTIAYDRGLNLDDLLFKFGVRVNPDLVEDMQSAKLNIVVGTQGGKPQTEALQWPYFPLLNGSLTHPISKNLDPVFSRYPNSIDEVKADGVQKTVLLQSSANARKIGTPAIVTLEVLKYKDDPTIFNQPNIPVAMLMEGRFHSLFENRLPATLADSLANVWHQPFVAGSTIPSRVIVCADGDIFMNDLTQQGPLQLGYSRDDGYTFANQDFIDNCVDYLVNPSGILETRAKDYTLRLLDPSKVEQQRPMWQFINIGLPLILVILGGYIYSLLRKRKYAA
jgi:gliding-associated putative ABC transporter substrate-binding component GldG